MILWLPLGVECFGKREFPNFQSFFDLFGLTGWGKFPDKWYCWINVTEQFFEVEFAGEWNTVVALGPVDIVYVAAYQIRSHFSEPLVVIE